MVVRAFTTIDCHFSHIFPILKNYQTIKVINTGWKDRTSSCLKIEFKMLFRNVFFYRNITWLDEVSCYLFHDLKYIGIKLYFAVDVKRKCDKVKIEYEEKIRNLPDSSTCTELVLIPESEFKMIQISGECMILLRFLIGY